MAKSKEKPQVEDNHPQGDKEQDHIKSKKPTIEQAIKMAQNNTSLISDCIGVLKDYKVWLNDVDDQLKKIKSRLGL